MEALRQSGLDLLTIPPEELKHADPFLQRVYYAVTGPSQATYRRELEALADPAAFAWLEDPRTGELALCRRPKKLRRRCGATCRDGQACRARVVPGRKRCRLHGGLSTGPKTAEGRARIADSNRRRAQH